MGDDFEEDEYDYAEPDDCDCSEYESDVIEGRAWCSRCGRHWFLTSEDLKREMKLQAEYQEHIACIEAEEQNSTPAGRVGE